MDHFWGIDLGGTKIEGVVCTRANPLQPLCRIRINTESSQGFDHIVQQVGVLVEQMVQTVGFKPQVIGFGTPGVLDPQTQTMKNCNTTCLNGRPLQRALEEILGIKARLSNDANCFALAEATMGAAKGASVVFGVIMGTGVGGGVVVKGETLYGCQGIAGEWGHNVIDPTGPACYCGKNGCVETIISGPALEKFYASLSGKVLSLNEIIAQVESDIHARATLDRLCDYFGRSLGVVINILDPEVVVLGGGVSNVSALYTQGVKSLSKYVFNNRLETKIVQNVLGDSAGVFGAALISWDCSNFL